ncbi:MAG: SCP2 sterol-binding domain-containing protein [Methylobacterium mesophilicum]|nr:SCP2 sterol-binding domain-containing protein [Methylobacterium mesophilicum]
MDIETIAQKINERMAGSGFSRTVKLDFRGEGTVLIDGATARVGDGDADCTITVSKDDFADIVSGELNPTTAFMTGKMKIDGDMGAAMALGQAL